MILSGCWTEDAYKNKSVHNMCDTGNLILIQFRLLTALCNTHNTGAIEEEQPPDFTAVLRNNLTYKCAELI